MNPATSESDQDLCLPTPTDERFYSWLLEIEPEGAQEDGDWLPDQTQLPNLPSLPNLTQLPNLPSLPNLTQLPNLPSLPNLTQLPNLPVTGPGLWSPLRLRLYPAPHSAG